MVALYNWINKYIIASINVLNFIKMYIFYIFGKVNIMKIHEYIYINIFMKEKGGDLSEDCR